MSCFRDVMEDENVDDGQMITLMLEMQCKVDKRNPPRCSSCSFRARLGDDHPTRSRKAERM